MNQLAIFLTKPKLHKKEMLHLLYDLNCYHQYKSLTHLLLRLSKLARQGRII